MSLIMDVLSKTKVSASEPVSDQSPEELNQPQDTNIKVKAARSSSKWIFFLIGAAAVVIGISLWMLNTYNHSNASPQISKAALLTPAKKESQNSWKTPLSVFKETPKNKAVLEGIILDDQQSVCLIGGKIYKVGDTWDGKKITEITASQVSLKDLQGNISVLESQA